jgi:hypothetical protein
MMMWQTPAVVLTFLAWFLAPTTNLADISRREAVRRQLTPHASRSLTDLDVQSMPSRPLPTVPALQASGEAAAGAGDAKAEKETKDKDVKEGAKKESETHDETYWRDRIDSSRKALERDRLLVDSLQSRVNALTADWSARDDPAQRADLWAQRGRTLEELEKMKQQVLDDQKNIDNVQEDGRREGVPPAWIR